MIDGLFSPIPPVKATARLALASRADGPLRLARFALLPVARLGQEEFASEEARRLLAGASLHTDLFPQSVLSGFYGWVLCSLGQ